MKKLQLKNYKMKKKGLGNPALIMSAVAATPQGQKVIGNALESATKNVENGANILKGGLKILFFGSVAYIGYKMVFGNFKKISEDKRYTPSNISTGLAVNKSETIFKAMYGVGNGFNAVKNALSGLNHNAFIRVYNAFGHRKGMNVLNPLLPINPYGKNMNLVEWFQDQFSPIELMELRFIMPNFF